MVVGFLATGFSCSLSLLLSCPIQGSVGQLVLCCWKTQCVLISDLWTQVRLVSEHPHSDDYIIRSFYLQNSQVRGPIPIPLFQFHSLLFRRESLERWPTFSTSRGRLSEPRPLPRPSLSSGGRSTKRAVTQRLLCWSTAVEGLAVPAHTCSSTWHSHGYSQVGVASWSGRGNSLWYYWEIKITQNLQCFVQCLL